jgi:hypothetical protein
MINLVSQQSDPPAVKPPSQGLNISITADALLFLMFILWIIWKRAIKPTFAEQLGSFFIPVEEERRLNTILAQIGVVTSASRVVLAAFHNGALDSDGYHLQRLSTINTYVRDGCSPMSVPIKNLPISKIAYEIEEMLKAGDWHEIKYAEDLPDNCKAHMTRNSMACMHNRLIRVGNLPIGVISLQYNKDFSSSDDGNRISRTAYEGLLEDLYDQISGIMRRRVINPGPVKRLFSQAIGMVKI